MDVIRGLGVFQGDAPQFIIFSVSILFYVYFQKLIWQSTGFYAGGISSTDDEKLGNFNEPGEDISESMLFNFVYFLEVFLICGIILILIRIICFHYACVCHVRNVITLTILDYSIIGYFFVILISPPIIFKLIYALIKESNLKFDSPKYE
jgi:hypothetical protein